MSVLVVARGGPDDGEVTGAPEPPAVGTAWWYPHGVVEKTWTGPYRVTGEQEALPDGRAAYVVEFDG